MQNPKTPVRVRLQAGWRQPVLFALSLGLAAALYGLPFLTVAANRLILGEPVYFFSLLNSPERLLAGLALLQVAMLLATAWLTPARFSLQAAALIVSLVIPAFLALGAAHATFVSQTESPIARTSLASGFWVSVILCGVIAADALQRIKVRPLAALMMVLVIVVPVAVLLASGWCDQLSIMKEYASRSDTFFGAIARHVQIVVIAVGITLCIGLPLGWAAARSSSVGGAMFPVLNIVQTIPSIALFGMLMAPLALLAASVPAFGRAGISGVGLAPGVIALVLYSLLPVVRGMLAGLEQVSSGVKEAAKGMGMPAWQIFWTIEVPLALPVVLGGVRTATIQAIGLAAVTALIGAGGLGAIMFEGLFASAQDLVLLGVLPIIALGALADGIFKLLIDLSASASTQGQQRAAGEGVGP